MTSPYTPLYLDAFMAAQTSVGLVLGACLWRRPMRPVVSSWLVLLAIMLAVGAPVMGDFAHGIGLTVSWLSVKLVLKVSAAVITLGAVLTRRPWLIVVAAGGELLLWWVTNFIQESDNELAAAHVAFFGLLLGLHWRSLPKERSAPPLQSVEQPGRP